MTKIRFVKKAKTAVSGVSEDAVLTADDVITADRGVISADDVISVDAVISADDVISVDAVISAEKAIPKKQSKEEKKQLAELRKKEKEQLKQQKALEKAQQKALEKERKLAEKKESQLHTAYLNDESIRSKYEVGVDEAGRGPLFGRVYAAAVVLPKAVSDASFDFSLMKDSKKFHSEKKIKEAAEYIKQNAVAWSVCYEEAGVIDKINIRQATLKCMQTAIKNVISSLGAQISNPVNREELLLMIDGNDFIPMTQFDKQNQCLRHLHHVCVEGGDNTYANIAAASILAKVERDAYIDGLCDKYPELDEFYGIRGNKGYGAKKHLDGIRQHGITQWHRKSYGICKGFNDDDGSSSSSSSRSTSSSHSQFHSNSSSRSST